MLGTPGARAWGEGGAFGAVRTVPLGSGCGLGYTYPNPVVAGGRVFVTWLREVVDPRTDPRTATTAAARRITTWPRFAPSAASAANADRRSPRSISHAS